MMTAPVCNHRSCCALDFTMHCQASDQQCCHPGVSKAFHITRPGHPIRLSIVWQLPVCRRPLSLTSRVSIVYLQVSTARLPKATIMSSVFLLSHFAVCSVIAGFHQVADQQCLSQPSILRNNGPHSYSPQHSIRPPYTWTDYMSLLSESAVQYQADLRALLLCTWWC